MLLSIYTQMKLFLKNSIIKKIYIYLSTGQNKSVLER